MPLGARNLQVIAEPDVDGQPVAGTPVVLDESLVVDRRVGALAPPRQLRVGAEDAERRVGEAEARVERVERVVGEVDRAEDIALALAPKVTL